MKIISTTLSEYTKSLLEEISGSTSEYFHPKAKSHQIFEQAYMKFLNGNLNYFNFESMVAQTLENDPFNSEFPKTLEFCEFSRTITNTYTPYGRMCIWYIPPNSRILPHVDDLPYHRHIIRNIFVLSKNVDSKHLIVVNGRNVYSDAGLYFQFSPATEKHSFINLSDEPYYFLGYDFWLDTPLKHAIAKTDVQAVINDPERIAEYGTIESKAKYISSH